MNMIMTAMQSLSAVCTIYMNGDSYNILLHILIALVIGFFLAFAVVSSMKAKLKSVSKRETAQEYVKQNSLKLTTKTERYLYSKTEKRDKPQNNNNR